MFSDYQLFFNSIVKADNVQRMKGKSTERNRTSTVKSSEEDQITRNTVFSRAICFQQNSGVILYYNGLKHYKPKEFQKYEGCIYFMIFQHQAYSEI